MGGRECIGGELVRFGGLGGVDNESGRRGLRSSSVCQFSSSALLRVGASRACGIEDMQDRKSERGHTEAPSPWEVFN